MDLTELREQIDGIDEEIVRLYEQRMEISRQVAEYKTANGKKVLDKQREAEKLPEEQEKEKWQFFSRKYWTIFYPLPFWQGYAENFIMGKNRMANFGK